MKKNPIDTVLEELCFTDNEKSLFNDIINMSKTYQKLGTPEQIKAYINLHIDSLVNHEIKQN